MIHCLLQSYPFDDIFYTPRATSNSIENTLTQETLFQYIMLYALHLRTGVDRKAFL